MTLQSKIKKALFAAAFGAGLVATAVPAQALDRGFLAGLIGGVALSALAASAQANRQAVPVVTMVPADLDTFAVLPEDSFEVLPEAQSQARPVRRGQQKPRVTHRPRVAGVSRPLQVRAPQAVSAAVTRCGDYLTKQTRHLGANGVRVSSAGPEVRSPNGVITQPIRARIEYARKGAKQVREARVTCRVNADGQVAAIQ